jgi:hypothetical protein
MIAFTCDVDWASEEIIDDTLNLFELFGVKCTFFSTHHSISLSKCSRKNFEVGIHPDFTPALNGDPRKTVDDILDEILDIHPEAQGVRCHTLFQNVSLLQKFADKKLLYDANNLLPYQTNLQPFKLWNKLIRIPYNWEDDVHWAYGYSFDDSRIDLNSEGLLIFDFHPIHIFLNTENKYRYKEAKKFMNDRSKLLEYRNNEVPGTRDLLLNLLKHCRSESIRTYKLKEIAYECLQNNF